MDLYGSQGIEILWAVRNHGRCVSTGVVSIVDSQSWIVLRDLSIHSSIYPSETLGRHHVVFALVVFLVMGQPGITK